MPPRSRIDKSLTAELEKGLQMIGMTAGTQISKVVARQLERQLGHLGGRIKYDLNVKMGGEMGRFSRQLAFAQLRGMAGFVRRIDMGIDRIARTVVGGTIETFQWGWRQLVKAVEATTEAVQRVQTEVRSLDTNLTGGRAGLYAPQSRFALMMKTLMGYTVMRKGVTYSRIGLGLQRLMYGGLLYRRFGALGGIAGALGPPELMRFAAFMSLLPDLSGGLEKASKWLGTWATQLEESHPRLAAFVRKIGGASQSISDWGKRIDALNTKVKNLFDWVKEHPYLTGAAAAGGYGAYKVGALGLGIGVQALLKAYGPLFLNGALKVSLVFAEAGVVAALGYAVGRSISDKLGIRQLTIELSDWLAGKLGQPVSIGAGPVPEIARPKLYPRGYEAHQLLRQYRRRVGEFRKQQEVVALAKAEPMSTDPVIRQYEQVWRSAHIANLTSALERTQERLAELSRKLEERGVSVSPELFAAGGAIGDASPQKPIHEAARTGMQ